jgi:hypothetical protein
MQQQFVAQILHVHRGDRPQSFMPGPTTQRCTRLCSQIRAFLARFASISPSKWAKFRDLLFVSVFSREARLPLLTSAAPFFESLEKVFPPFEAISSFSLGNECFEMPVAAHTQFVHVLVFGVVAIRIRCFPTLLCAP